VGQSVQFVVDNRNERVQRRGIASAPCLKQASDVVSRFIHLGDGSAALELDLRNYMPFWNPASLRADRISYKNSILNRIDDGRTRNNWMPVRVSEVGFRNRAQGQADQAAPREAPWQANRSHRIMF